MRILACWVVAASVVLGGALLTSAQTKPATEPVVKTKVAVFRLGNTLLERPASFNFRELMGGTDKQPALSALLVTLTKASKDANLGGVIVDLKGFDLTLAQAQELGGLLKKVRDAKKQVVVFASDYDTATYILASHANFVVMPEHGNVMIPGVQMGMMFFKNALANLHMQADFVQVGKYKGAEEPFMRTEASPEYKAQIDGLADAMYDQMVNTIAKNRKLDAKEVKAAIDEAWMTGKRAKELGLVDQLMDRQQMETWASGLFKDGADLVRDYGEVKKKSIDLNNPFAIFAMFSDTGKPKTRTNQPAVAIIYADGTITGDTADDGIFEEEGNVTPSLVRKAVDKALKDDLVKAIVLRVDSPGGSASASDEIWQILKEADKKKPVSVSMGRVAASGGYYIACAGRKITADEATITGSIGVVGGKIVMKGLLDWAGVGIQPVARGKRAMMFSAQTAFTDEERGFVRGLMTETYDLFTSRVKAGRGAKIAKIEDVAQGRLFDGAAAKKAGLVDEVGTLDDAVASAAKGVGIERSYQVLVLPEPKTLQDLLSTGLSMEAKLPVEMRAAWGAVPAEYRGEAVKMLRLVRVAREEKVMVVAPVGIVEK